MRTDRRSLLLLAMFVDTFGGGLLLPFELVYAIRVAHLSLPTAGLLLSIGAGASIALGPVAGAAVDRFGPIRVVVLANLFGVAGCASLLAWTNVWGYATAAFLFSANLRVFWASYTPLVASIASAGDLEGWFGRLRAARYVGLAGGQALSGTAFALGEEFGLRLIVATDGLSFALAIPLILLSGAGSPPVPHGEAGGAASYRVVLADRLNSALAVLNVAATVLLTAPILALPVFVLDRLALSALVPGLLTGSITAVAALGMLFVGKLLGRRRRLRNMQLAIGLWALAFLSFGLAPIGGTLTYTTLFIGAILVGLGEAVYAPTADAIPAALAPVHLRGRYAALHQLAWGVSETVTPTFVALALTSDNVTLWLLLAGLAGVAIAGYRWLEHQAGNRDGLAGAELRGSAAASG